MAILKLFSASSSRSPSPASFQTVKITHHVHAFGGIYLPSPSAPSADNQPEVPYGGRLEIHLTPGSGRRRCQNIKVGIRTVSTLDLGQKRGKEEDVVFERIVSLGEGTILEEGSQFFEWSLSIPRNLAAHDWHPEGKVVHTLFAEVEGESPRGKRRAASPRRAISTDINSTPSRPPSPTHSPTPAGSPLGEKPPEYTGDERPGRPERQERVPALKGRFEGKRSLMVIHELPGGGTADLDLRGDGAISGLGMYNLRLTSDVWSVCALFKYHLSIPDPSPLATIYAIRIFLEQTTHVTSPRDGASSAAPISRLRPFEVLSLGKHPHPQQRLTGDVPAIWRGSEKEFCDIEGYARLPDDEFARPSTPEGISTPLRVSHALVMEVWFSLQGQDEWGRPCEEYKTRVRTLTLRKAVMIPSCALIPEFVDLPTYASIENTAPPSRTDLPCVLCRRNIAPGDYKAKIQLAKQRYHSDAPSQLPEGECKICGRNFVLPGSGMWRDCACGLSLDEMEQRMKKVETAEGIVGEGGQNPVPKET